MYISVVLVYRVQPGYMVLGINTDIEEPTSWVSPEAIPTFLYPYQCTCRVWGKEKKETPIQRPVWYVNQKLIPVQHSHTHTHTHTHIYIYIYIPFVVIFFLRRIIFLKWFSVFQSWLVRRIRPMGRLLFFFF